MPPDTIMRYVSDLTVLQSRLGLWVFVTLLCLLRPLKSVAFVSGAALAVYVVIFFLIGYYGASASASFASSAPSLPSSAPLLSARGRFCSGPSSRRPGRSSGARFAGSPAISRSARPALQRRSELEVSGTSC